MRRTLLLVAALALTPLALLVSNEAQACSCIPTKDAVTSARDSKAVFEGKLIAVETPKPVGPYDLQMKIFTFEVKRTFKGQLDSQVTVESAESSAACGRDFGKNGDAWLIYARANDQGQLYDGLCSRTKPIEHAAADIAELEANMDSLDEPNPPAKPEPPIPPSEQEPRPIQPPEVDEAGEAGEPEPAEPSKRGCSIGAGTPESIPALALLGLLALPWSRSRRRRS